MMQYVVSACLAGIRCRYDGKSCSEDRVVELTKKGLALPVCPEILGGLGIPRTPCEIRVCGEVRTVVDRRGRKRTAEFKKGAEKTLAICRIIGAGKALLKEKSPSCGLDYIYDGTFSGQLVPRRGITAALLIENGIKVEGINTEADMGE